MSILSLVFIVFVASLSASVATYLSFHSPRDNAACSGHVSSDVSNIAAAD